MKTTMVRVKALSVVAGGIGATIVVLVLATGLAAQDRAALSDVTRQFVSVDAPVVALEHVRVIDGTGAPVAQNQTVLIENGTIRAVGPDGSVTVPSGARVMDLSGRTVIPGLVGMHNHLFYQYVGDPEYPSPALSRTMTHSFPRLFLAAGVTTIRTTGSREPDTEVRLKESIDSGKVPGPEIFATSPTLDGPGNNMAQVRPLKGPEDATEVVNFWANRGITSFKVQTNITRAQLAAVIKAAHARGLKVTGHLCAVGWTEAAKLGIDDFAHGIDTNSEIVPDKKPDMCPPGAAVNAARANYDVKGKHAQDLIRELVQRNISVTATPSDRPDRPQSYWTRVLPVLSEPTKLDLFRARARNPQPQTNPGAEAWARKVKEFYHDFVKAGGLLMAGPDTGGAGTIAGFADHRVVALLVHSEGFTPVEAIQIYTLNGAKGLGIANRVGSVQVGKQANLVVVRGDPSQKIEDVENVEIVFKNGIGFDPQKLYQSVLGQVGLR